jgi:hypothetical protein
MEENSAWINENRQTIEINETNIIIKVYTNTSSSKLGPEVII